LKRSWPFALVAALLAFGAAAIEPPQDAPATPPAEAPPPDAAQPADGEAKGAPAPAAGDEDELPPLPPDTAPAGPPPQRFNPTEKVRADFPVSFPIDI